MFVATPPDNLRLANLCGPLDANLRQIEDRLGVRITRRDATFLVDGAPVAQRRALAVLERLHRQDDATLTSEEVELMIIETIDADRQAEAAARLAAVGERPRRSQVADAATGSTPEAVDPADSDLPAAHPGVPAATGADGDDPSNPSLPLRKAIIQGRTEHQRDYLRNVLGHDITFGIGPAGTGKTYLAVACAAAAFERDEVARIVLTRPAVEAGERLGYLPGDLAQKVDPYLRPLYDALYDLMGFDKVTRLFERQSIEIAPLAYMRGRTLNRSFIILDEAQNTTPEQMKMFLTRIGFGSKAVVTGDVTQIDLPKNQLSGLVQAQRILGGVRGIAFTRFTSQDVVRHPLVARIVDAYERHADEPDPAPSRRGGRGDERRGDERRSDERRSDESRSDHLRNDERHHRQLPVDGPSDGEAGTP